MRASRYSKIRKLPFKIDKSIKMNKVTATLRCAFLGDFGEEVEAWTSDFIAKKEVVL